MPSRLVGKLEASPVYCAPFIAVAAIGPITATRAELAAVQRQQSALVAQQDDRLARDPQGDLSVRGRVDDAGRDLRVRHHLGRIELAEAKPHPQDAAHRLVHLPRVEQAGFQRGRRIVGERPGIEIGAGPDRARNRVVHVRLCAELAHDILDCARIGHGDAAKAPVAAQDARQESRALGRRRPVDRIIG